MGQQALKRGYCGRSVEGGLCGRPATLHVIWEGRVHSFACDEHGKELEGKRYEQVHAHEAACADPRSMWFPELHKCAIPRTEAETAIGIFLID